MRIRRYAKRVSAVVSSGFERVDRAAMFVIPRSPKQNNSQQRQRSGQASAKPALARANFLVDQGKQRGHNQTQNEHCPHDRLGDEDDVPRIPFFRERPKRPHPVVIREVEKNVAESGKAGIEEKQSPARGQLGVFDSATAKSPDQIDEADHSDSIQRHAQKRMGEAAMMGEAEGRPANPGQNVKIGRFSRQREGERGESGLAIKSGAAHTRAKKKMSDGFQVVNRILFGEHAFPPIDL